MRLVEVLSRGLAPRLRHPCRLYVLSFYSLPVLHELRETKL